MPRGRGRILLHVIGPNAEMAAPRAGRSSLQVLMDASCFCAT